MKKRQDFESQGFTLVELMIVVVIIGLLASFAIPAFNRTRVVSRGTAFLNDLRVFADAADTYMIETGEYLEDSGSGSVPTGWDAYISTAKWTGGTPIGGVWDVELDSFGIKAGLGVHGPDFTSQQMQDIEDSYDDGDLSTGKFRRIAADRYYFILEDNP